jgi:hypothetical protein
MMAQCLIIPISSRIRPLIVMSMWGFILMVGQVKVPDLQAVERKESEA